MFTSAEILLTDAITKTIRENQRQLTLKLKDLKRTYTNEMIGRVVEIKELDWETREEYSDVRLREMSSKVKCDRGVIVAVDVVDGTPDGMSDEDYRHLFSGSIKFDPNKDLGRVYVTVEFVQRDGSTQRFHFNEYEFNYL